VSSLTIQQLWQAYQQLRAQLDSGQLSHPQFVAQVQQLQACDSSGTWWMIDAQTGGYLRYDGVQWVPDYPRAPMPVAPAPVRAKRRGIGCGNITRFAGLIVPLIIAGFWTLYTAIPGHSEGIDLMTPLIVGGVPAALWFFRKQVDGLLKPFEPLRTKFPRTMLVGAAMALPVVLGIICSSTGGGAGYDSMRFTSLVSILGAHILTRRPEVQL
jgi:hypothetical protein